MQINIINLHFKKPEVSIYLEPPLRVRLLGRFRSR